MTDVPAGPPDAQVVPRFSGPDTFARLPRLADVGSAAANVVYELLGLPSLQGAPGTASPDGARSEAARSAP